MERLATRPITLAMRTLVLALALLLSGPVMAAGFACAPPADPGGNGGLDELDEVVVTGEQPRTATKDLQAWLRLLVGKYTYEGYVDLCGKGNAEDLRTVTGRGECIGTGSTPHVHCTVNVRWPETSGEDGAPVLGGASNLIPAQVIYSLETFRFKDARADGLARSLMAGASRPSERRVSPDQAAANAEARLRQFRQAMKEFPTSGLRLMFMQVDNRGIAEWATGELVGDTFTSREPCVGLGIAAPCRKTTRITARPDSDEIFMVVNIEVANQRVLRQAFQLNREPSGGTTAPSGRRPP